MGSSNINLAVIASLFSLVIINPYSADDFTASESRVTITTLLLPKAFTIDHALTIEDASNVDTRLMIK